MSGFIATLLGVMEVILFYELLFESKKNWNNKTLISIILYILVTIGMKLIIPDIDNIIFTMLGFIPFNLWILENTWKKIMLYIFSGIYCTIVFLPVKTVIEHWGNVNGENSTVSFWVPIIDCLLVCFLVFLKRNKKYEAMNVTYIKLWVVGLTNICGVLGTLVISFVYVISDNTIMDDKIKSVVLVITTLLGVTFLFFGIIILFIGYTNEISLKEKKEKENLLLLMESYYEQIKSYDKEISKIKHDMKDHLESMRHLMEEQKIEEAFDYVNDILGSVKSVEKIVNLGNDFVSAIINNKKQIANEKNIKFNATGYIPKNIEISNTDLCTIFANLLNNAIEACVNTANSFIEVNVIMNSDTLCIDITNSVNEENINYSSTSKKDKVNHGFGIQNVKEVVQKYGGEMKINIESKKFNVFIVIDDVKKG